MTQHTSKIQVGIYMSIFMLVYAALHAFILRAGLQFSWAVTFVDVLSMLLGVTVIVVILNYKAVNGAHTFSRIAIIIIQSLLLAIICQYFIEWLMMQAWRSSMHYIIFYQQTLYVRMLIMWIVVCNISIIRLLLISAYISSEATQRTMYNEQLVKDAELFKLRQQINPHFLFNTLNSINALVVINPTKAREMIEQLSTYFRSNINKDEYEWVSLREELKDIHLYFEIEKIRFGHRLALDQSIDEAALSYKVPPLLLQPLVENAIKYGLYGVTGNITIQLKVYIQMEAGTQPVVVFEIINPFDPAYKQVTGTGFGLHAINRRLYLLFSRNDLLHTYIDNSPEQAEVRIFKAVLRIPVNIHNDETYESNNN